jgi:hypothetical protein
MVFASKKTRLLFVTSINDKETTVVTQDLRNTKYKCSYLFNIEEHSTYSVLKIAPGTSVVAAAIYGISIALKPESSRKFAQAVVLHIVLKASDSNLGETVSD